MQHKKIGMAGPSGLPSGRRGAFGSRFRFGLAGFLRRSERLVDGLVARYEDATSLDTADAADIYRDIGADCASKGDVDGAIESFEHALALEPDDADARFELGVLYLRQGAAKRAAAALMEARASGMEGFALHYHLGEAYADLERREAAVEELRAAIAIRRTPEAAYRLGVVLDELGRFAEAREAFEMAIELAPNEIGYHQSLGFTLESLGRRDDALVCFKRALSLERRTRRRIG